MYTRAYDENLGIVIPESYNGTALREESRQEPISTPKDEERQDEQNGKNPWEEPVHKDEDDKYESAGAFYSKLPFNGFLSNFFENGKFSLQKIGTEEILIIATAAFLLFSKDGDKECAIMLLLLLFLY